MSRTSVSLRHFWATLLRQARGVTTIDRYAASAGIERAASDARPLGRGLACVVADEGVRGLRPFLGWTPRPALDPRAPSSPPREVTVVGQIVKARDHPYPC